MDIQFQKERVGQKGDDMILYFQNSIPVVQVDRDNNADHSKSTWCNIVTLNSLITIGLMYLNSTQ